MSSREGDEGGVSIVHLTDIFNANAVQDGVDDSTHVQNIVDQEDPKGLKTRRHHVSTAAAQSASIYSYALQIAKAL